MIKEDKQNIAHILRCETGCGMMEAIIAIEKLIDALKHKPVIYDNPPHIKIIWEQYDTGK